MVNKNVPEAMESARDVANGTMEMWVLFETDEEVAEARAWMKGRQKVKNLVPITEVDARKQQQDARKAIAKKLAIKKKNE